jgi:drug/metabolite transporter (DMT)-like permease
MIKEENVKV